MYAFTHIGNIFSVHFKKVHGPSKLRLFWEVQMFFCLEHYQMLHIQTIPPFLYYDITEFDITELRGSDHLSHKCHFGAIAENVSIYITASSS